jgi:ribonuclease HI
MKTFVIDGSCKGICMGAGIVEINSIGFLDVYSFKTYHVEATANLSEVFALECVLNLLRETDNPDNHIVIFTDNEFVLRSFTKDLNKNTNDVYLSLLKKQIKLLKQFIKFEIRQKDGSVKSVHNISHKLSRTYLEDPISNKVMNQTISLNLITV